MFDLNRLKPLSKIQVMDEPDPESHAYHKYYIQPGSSGVNSVDIKAAHDAPASIRFQKGPNKGPDADVNGIHIEDLLQVCAHRLTCFQTSKFACEENELALESILDALKWLSKRTMDRQVRGVEGTREL
jgi:hypothetical protein